MKVSIKTKIFISFLVLNVFIFSFMVVLSINLFRRNNQEFIKYDLLKVHQDAESFITQYIKTNKIGLSKTVFEEKDSLLKELDSDLGVRGNLYDLEGKIVSGSTYDKDIFSRGEKDLEEAIKGVPSYVIFEKDGKVVASIPVVIGGSTLWVYRFVKDYTSIFNNSHNLNDIIIAFGGASILLILIISLLISKSITSPILKLKESTNRIALKEYDTVIDVKSEDEIGDLAQNFKVMQARITEHISTIEKDKDLLNELLVQRKKFFDSVTHELKTPLTTIQGYTQMIAQNGFEDKDFFDKGTTHIIEESIRLHKLVLSLLEMSEQNSINIKSQFEKLNLSHILREVCEGIKIKAKQNDISIEPCIAEKLTIKGSSDDIKGMILNLIDNAIKYSGEKSVIKVCGEEKDNAIEIIVQDNGVGIPKDKLDKIFEPFYRVDTKKSKKLGGSGLGLSIVKNIVDVHGGSIQIESIENKGTKAIVRLPKNLE